MFYKCSDLRGGEFSVSFWKHLDKWNVIQKVANPQTQTLPERPDWKGMKTHPQFLRSLLDSP